MDQLDANILAVLMKDGRSSNIEVARAVRASEATVRRRIDAMIGDGVFQFIAVADQYKIGYGVQAFIGITVESSKLKQVTKQLGALSAVRFIVYTTGPYSLFAQAFFADITELKSFLTDQITLMPGILKTETAIVLGFTKRSWEFQLTSPEISKIRHSNVKPKHKSPRNTSIHTEPTNHKSSKLPMTNRKARRREDPKSQAEVSHDD
jgi:Lrp/AsnC family transcriptional regulator, regulator for asnA, asnC and gidA